jgi:hypothetical protein
LHAELEKDGLTVVTVALDIEPAHAHPWIDAAAPTHPSLIDTQHVTGELFGFINIPMAVWIDESGMIVRNAESAAVVRSPLRDLEIPDGLDERMTRMLTEVKAIRDDSEPYRAAIVDWVRNGADSTYALGPDEVVARSRPRGAAEAEAAACFELGRYLRDTVGEEAAVSWWRRAHQLDPGNWTYKRQAWTLVTTPEGATENDLVQGPNDVYAGNWLDDVLASGGGANYYPPPQL